MDIMDVVTTEEGFALRFRPRPSTTVTLPIPNDTLAALEKVAAGRDMSVEALLKFYIGQGLRQDLWNNNYLTLAGSPSPPT